MPVAELIAAEAPAVKREQEKPKLSDPRILRAKPGVRQDVFSIAEGEVSIQWPASLSPESFEDIGDWLDILKRKIGRSVRLEEPTD